MATQSQNPPIQTIEITNFRGSLTRILNGDMNSGLAKFTSSFGYDPFSKPMNLTWLEAPVDITGSIVDLIIAAKPRLESNQQYIYALGHLLNIYKITPNTISSPNADTPSVIGKLTGIGTAGSYGASMDFFGDTEKIFFGLKDRVVSVNFDGSGQAAVGTLANYYDVVFRPVLQFLGYLMFGNKRTIGLIDSTGTVISPVVGLGASSVYSSLAPPLPTETNITDIDLSPDGNYSYITTSGIANENIVTLGSDRNAAASSNGNIYYWNGVDAAITATKSIPSYAVTALQAYLDTNMFFSDDSFGASISDGTSKKISLPNNKSPLPNAVSVNGNFLTWVSPELTSDGTGMNASMYYYGNLDDENQKGLWRVVRYSTTLSNGFIYQTPVNLMTNNKYSTVNDALTAIVPLGYGKHYFSVYDFNSTTNKYTLQRFLITPTGTGTPQLGVYETQTQLFSKRITIKQIRVYTEPTVANNGFKVDVIGSNGSVQTNGTFNYTYSAGTDITKLQGALERIDFNPAMLDLYSVGLRITNTGTTNMTIHKIEVDYVQAGK